MSENAGPVQAANLASSATEDPSIMVIKNTDGTETKFVECVEPISSAATEDLAMSEESAVTENLEASEQSADSEPAKLENHNVPDIKTASAETSGAKPKATESEKDEAAPTSDEADTAGEKKVDPCESSHVHGCCEQSKK